MAENNRGQFVWHELMTTDTQAAAGFYARVAGLKTELAPGAPSYTLFVASAGRMGGLMTLGPDAKVMSASPHWLSYVKTLNVEETARKAESLGGKIIKPPADMGDGGRFAILQDPQGAVFAVYVSPRPFTPSADVPLGHCSWHELATSDHDAAFPFYQQLFGWETTSTMDMGPQGLYRMFGPAGRKEPFGGMYTKSAQQAGPPAWLPYIKVANVKAATAKAKAAGAQILHGPAQVPGGGWISMGTDPQGAAFAVHSVAAAVARPAARPKSKPKAKETRKAKAAPKRKSAPKRRVTKKKAKAAPSGARRRAGSKKR